MTSVAGEPSSALPAVDGVAGAFHAHHAVVLGVDTYRDTRVAPLRTAVADASAVARVLHQEHGFHIDCIVDAAATCDALGEHLERTLPARVGAEDRLVVYVACHGIPVSHVEGPAGYLLLHDAARDDVGTFFPMQRLHDALTRLPCQHVLVILDCCFAGTFRWSSYRDLVPEQRRPVERERYERFVRAPAWQVITSAASDQRALDTLVDGRGTDGEHSPFARALLDGLRGAADLTGDGLITATELYLFLRDRVELTTTAAGLCQTPGLHMLKKHARGEFVFQVPGRPLELSAAPALSLEANPYRGLEVFDEEHRGLFFGRSEVLQRLQAFVTSRALTVVLGPSGTGKSSLLRAGLCPALREAGFRVAPPWRTGASPLASFQALCASLDLTGGAHEPLILIVVDQLEEIVTLATSVPEREGFLAALGAILVVHRGRLHVGGAEGKAPALRSVGSGSVPASARLLPGYVRPVPATLQRARQGGAHLGSTRTTRLASTSVRSTLPQVRVTGAAARRAAQPTLTHPRSRWAPTGAAWVPVRATSGCRHQ
jgi:hypothetical protein